jgi:pimeloyl-ACP methyl ester carboxylesterase
MSEQHQGNAEPLAAEVASRRVYYISGFDPRGAAYYHRLYREQAALQGRVNGLDIVVGGRERVDDTVARWTIDATSEDRRIHTTYEFLRWDDVVRDNWLRGELRLVLATLRTFWIYISSGVLRKVLQSAWPTFITTIYPPLFLLAVISCAAGIAVGLLLILPLWLGGPAAVLAFYALILLGRRIEAHNNAYWLLRLYTFFVNQASDRVPALESRLDEFAERILARIRQAQDDEILIVGHSTGAQLAVSLLARMLRSTPGLGSHGPRVALLTLGECIPMLSLLPGARACRDDLALVAAASALDWLDVTAPPDGACFALIDPVALSGITRAPGQAVKPTLVSPRFHAWFTPHEYARIRRDRLRIHFQYLMAAAIPGDYDYFAITAGPESLAERYRNTESCSGFIRFRVFQ